MLNPLSHKELMCTLYPRPVRCIIQWPFGHCEGCGIGIVIVVVRPNFGGGRPPSLLLPTW